MKITKRIFVSIVILAATFRTTFADDGLSEKTTEFKKFYQQNYLEQVYVHLDKRYYLTGEFIRFKIYCLEKTTSKPSQLSKVAYFEVLSEENKALIQAKVELKNGIGNGEIFIPTSINSGNFIVRSYTRWMRNMGPDYFYHSMVTVINPFKRLGLNPLPNPKEIFIKFYPEGGALLNRIDGKVVFECNNGDGYPVDFSGKLFANDSLLIKEFKPLKNGIGSFTFIPEIENDYHVELVQGDSLTTVHKIPVIIEEGLSVRMNENESGVIYSLYCSDSSIADPSEKLHYVIHHKGEIIDKDYKTLLNGKVEIQIERLKIHNGVTKISVFNSDNKLISQRQFFEYKDNDSKLVQLNRSKLDVREKVILDVSKLNKLGQDQPIDLSISVSSYHANLSNQQLSIRDYLLLSNSIGGFVYNIESFFGGAMEEIKKSINNLLIAHANLQTPWNNDTSSETNYIPECRYPIITGNIVNKLTGEPANGIYVYLSIPGIHPQFNAAISKSDGSITFELHDFLGSKEIIVQTDYTKDTIYDISIDNPFSKEFAEIKLPALNIEKSMASWIARQSQNMQITNAYRGYDPKPKNINKNDSSMFYNKPDSRYYLDDFTRFVVMEEVMREYVYGVNVRKNKQGFHFMTIDLDRNELFYENPLMLLDGIPVFDADEIIALDPLKVEKIETVKRRFHYGNLDCLGIVSYSTYKGDLTGYSLNKDALVLEYEGLQIPKQYNFTRYESSLKRNSTSPDFRNSLFWAPECQLEKADSTVIDFYTADDSNVYEIIINGITSQGIPFSEQEYFEVINMKRNLN